MLGNAYAFGFGGASNTCLKCAQEELCFRKKYTHFKAHINIISTSLLLPVIVLRRNLSLALARSSTCFFYVANNKIAGNLS